METDGSKNTTVMSYCGISCEECSNYKHHLDCLGCKHESTLIWDCGVRSCAALHHLNHCGECKHFPCAQLEAFYNNGKPSHLEAYHNILKLLETR